MMPADEMMPPELPTVRTAEQTQRNFAVAMGTSAVLLLAGWGTFIICDRLGVPSFLDFAPLKFWVIVGAVPLYLFLGLLFAGAFFKARITSKQVLAFDASATVLQRSQMIERSLEKVRSLTAISFLLAWGFSGFLLISLTDVGTLATEHNVHIDGQLNAEAEEESEPEQFPANTLLHTRRR